MDTTKSLIYELISAKDSLIDLRNILNNKILNIVDTIESYGFDEKGNNIKSAKELNVIDVVDNVDLWNSFPRQAGADKQLFWLFENYFKKGVKINELQHQFNLFTGDKKRIDNVARRLKREGRLVVVKYNNSNKLSYWGLPNWIRKNDFDASDFRCPTSPFK